MSCGPIIMKQGVWAVFTIYLSSNRKNARKCNGFYGMYRTKADARAACRMIKLARKLGDNSLGNNLIGTEIRPVDAFWPRVEHYRKIGDWNTYRLIAELGHDRSVLKRELNK